ncbi:50S ribosomal protein L23 [Patescibacteria group bacterium]|nr:50S ribosomal protein L23 [Patescibacteria group bacterium]
MQHTLLKPVITEKSVAGSEKGTYAFFVHPNSNKIQIKNAVKKAYKVEVESVRIINTKAKIKRRGRITGRTSRTKKAIVKLAKDQKIDFFDKI